MFKSILNLAWKEILQLLRDRVLLLFLILIPIVLLSLISESTGGGIRGIKYAVWDQEASPLSQSLVTAINNTGDFQLTFRAAELYASRESDERRQDRRGAHYSADVHA